MRSAGRQKQRLVVITDWLWRWPPCSAMQVHGSPRSQPSRSPMCKSQPGAACSSFDVAKDSSIARYRSSRKRANRSMPISNIVNAWLNTGASGQRKDEKQLLPGGAGRRDISFSVSADLWPNAAFARSSPSLVRPQNSLHLSAPTICAIRLLNPSLILLPMDWIAHQCRFRRFIGGSKEWFSAKEAGRLLGVHAKTIRFYQKN